jgi:hypothetical protein
VVDVGLAAWIFEGERSEMALGLADDETPRPLLSDREVFEESLVITNFEYRSVSRRS